MNRVLTVMAAVSLLTGALPLAAGDTAVRERIEKRIDRAHLDQGSDVRVEVLNGEATLTGIVLSLPVKRSIEKAAHKEAETVHNRLRVFLEEPATDPDIIKAVRRTILRYTYYTVFDYVEFSVRDGEVVLQGSVLHPWRKRAIEERVAKVPGIRQIHNNLAVQQVSTHDTELRVALARRIYRDPRFIQYANRAHPPIHILVDKGHVTLAGYVNSPVEQAILGHIARGFLAFSVDNQIKVDGESPKEDRRKES